MSSSFEEHQDAAEPAAGTADPANEKSSDGPDFPTLAGRAQGFLNEGRFDAAREVFVELLEVIEEAPSYQRAVAFERVGFCSLMEGQPLVAAKYLQQSAEIVEAIELTDGARALQGIIQSELGQVFSLTGDIEQARVAYEAAVEIARSVDNQRALGIDLDHLGVLNLKQGRADEARAQFEEALAIFRDIAQPGAQAVALHHLGLAAEHATNWDDAEQHYTDGARLLVDNGDYVSAARLFSMAAAVCIKSGRTDAAEAWFRNSLEHSRLGDDPVDLRRTLSAFAKLLQSKPGGIGEARELVEEALAAGENSLELDVWALYGQLAEIIDQEAALSAEAEERQLLRTNAQTYRHVGEFGPRLLATLREIGEEPSFGAAVILERVGRCCLLGGRPAPAVILFRQALAALDAIPETSLSKPLRGLLQSGLGDAHRLAGFPSEAKKSYQAALDTARSVNDLGGELMQLTHLGAFALASGDPAEALRNFRTGAAIARKLGDKNLARGLRQQLEAVTAATGMADDEPDEAQEHEQALSDKPFDARVHESVVAECAFGSDLLIDLTREKRVLPLEAFSPLPLPDDARPALVPRVRIAMDEACALRFYIPAGEPELLQEQDCIVMRKAEREVVVEGRLDQVWRFIRAADGSRPAGSILQEIEEDERPAVEQLLAVLVTLGAYDVSGRPMGRFLHAATKKGVLAGGGLGGDRVLDLATDGGYRTYPDTQRVVLSEDVPESIAAFHTLTRSRRSRREYAGMELARSDFDALLHTACGITGTAAWSDREVKLRAYPSSGALYAVEAYPVVLGVEGLAPGIYHYVAGDNALNAVKVDFDVEAFIEACLPVERKMVSSAGVMICLVGEFRRHERKYGEGGYRMMVAEAGHISQNLILSATALGLSARPFGGVFDTLINRNLGLDENEEQFLLSVLVGQEPARDKEPTGEG